jgi:hypothetical protein
MHNNMITQAEITHRTTETLFKLFPNDFQVFRKTEMTSQSFAVLLAMTESNWTEAIVLWDLLIYHRRYNDLDDYNEISARELGKKYPNLSARTCLRAVESLISKEIVVRKPRVRNMSMLLRLDWEWLVLMVHAIPVDTYIPGVTHTYFTEAQLPSEA